MEHGTRFTSQLLQEFGCFGSQHLRLSTVHPKHLLTRYWEGVSSLLIVAGEDSLHKAKLNE